MFKERLPSRMESVPAHIARMIALLGPPSKELLKRGQFSDMFFDGYGELLGSTEEMICYLLCLGDFTRDVKVEDTSLEGEEENLEGEEKMKFLTFLGGMVRWMPEERKTAKELIDDPWLNNL
jgi:serine/threonine-protein kinase SRPK3